MKRLLTFLLVFGLLFSAQAMAAPAGLVMMVKGDAKVGGKPLKPKMPLNKGEKITAAAGAMVLYLTPAGQKVLVKGPVTHAVSGGGATAGSPGAAAKAMSLLSKGMSNMVDKNRDFKSQGGVGGVKRSGPATGSLVLTYPLNSAIREDRISITWLGDKGDYKVTLADDTGMEWFNLETPENVLHYPDSLHPMKPGGMYTLSVEGPAQGASTRQTSTFWLPEEQELAELDRQLAELEKEFASEPEAKLTLQAALLEAGGLYHEAVQLQNELLKRNPKDIVALIQKLQLQEKMGDTAGATQTHTLLDAPR